jgi:hypothetical protein
VETSNPTKWIMSKKSIIVLMLWWFIVDADSAIGSLRHVDVGSVAHVLEVHAASIFRVELSRVSQCSCISCGPADPWREGSGAGALFQANRDTFPHFPSSLFLHSWSLGHLPHHSTHSRGGYETLLGEQLDGWLPQKRAALVTFCLLTPLAQTGHEPPHLVPCVHWTKTYIRVYTRTLTHPTDFDPEDGGMYLQNIGSTSHIHMVQRS